MVTSNKLLDYYRQHSPITDPGSYASFLDHLPHDLPSLAQLVQNLIVHAAYPHLYGIQLSEERYQEMYLRTVPDMLGRILELNNNPLTVTRDPAQRKVGLCRDFAVLLVALLRHQGVPARLRVGFAGYFTARPPRFWDHRIAEFWHERAARWCLVDAQLDGPQQRTLGIGFDPLLIPERAPYYVAGQVWQSCRRGEVDPLDYGDSVTDRGMAPIRYALLHDFDALNKSELLGFDAWYELIEKAEHELTDNELLHLDAIAEVTVGSDSQLEPLRALYEQSVYGRAVQAQLRSLTG